MQSFDMGREVLKWIALLTMTVDHVGAIVYPDYSFFRVIGRLSFPLFCYILVLGVASTNNIRRYGMRLLIFASISQVPYFLALGHEPFDSFNIFFTLSLGVLLIYLYENHFWLILIPALVSVFVNIEYSVYGLTLIGCMYFLTKHAFAGTVVTILLNLIFLPTKHIQIYSIFALPIILLHTTGKIKSASEAKRGRLFRYFYYCYYPVHLTVLYMYRFFYL